MDWVRRLMEERGFTYPDGQLDYVAFYTHAQIGADVWSTFVNRRHNPSKETLLKLVFALRLNEEEAKILLALAGSGWLL